MGRSTTRALSERRTRGHQATQVGPEALRTHLRAQVEPTPSPALGPHRSFLTTESAPPEPASLRPPVRDGGGRNPHDQHVPPPKRLEHRSGAARRPLPVCVQPIRRGPQELDRGESIRRDPQDRSPTLDE